MNKRITDEQLQAVKQAHELTQRLQDPSVRQAHELAQRLQDPSVRQALELTKQHGALLRSLDLDWANVRNLEQLVRSLPQLRQLSQALLHMKQFDKNQFWQELSKACSEDVIQLRRETKAIIQMLPDKITGWRQVQSKIESDPSLARSLSPEEMAFLEDLPNEFQAGYELQLRNLSWIEEYMRSVIEKADLPSWVGSVSIGGDSSDHHLG